MKVSHTSVKGTPVAKGGHSSMQSQFGHNPITQPGKKFGSNTMSPAAFEGKYNEYGNK